ITMNTIAAGTETMQNFLNPGSDNPAPTTSAGRPLELAALSQAAALWKNPSFFEDIVAQYMRRLLRERAWDDVVRLPILMSRRLTPAMRGPLLYLSGRLIETGRASPDTSTDNEFRKYLENGSPEIAAGIGAPSVANLFFSVLLRESGIEEHYRTLAAWRLGTEPPLLSRVPALGKDYRVIDAITRALPAFDQPPVSDTILAEALAFIEQSLDYGLDALAAGQVGSLSSYSPDSLFWMARTFAEHEQYYPALRIGSEVLRRALPDSAAIAYALLYPLAWNGHFRELTETNRIAEPLAYALVRSESMFNQRAVSRSGALGLSQLLPSTAAETARGLKMQTYNLTDPRDNLAIGMAYFGYMLRRFGERPARAMAAYNAGPGHMMQWVADWGALEDDILIELYPIAEPRQYTKNIIAAALHYGKLYYGIAPADMLAFLLEGKALPNGTAPSMAGESSAQQPPVPQTAPSLSPLSSTP
ncbi:MAG: lytic transglycosylase domain-containing protein, partial [Rectinema sp.]|nr:lytic transglycosylase domain-containing protein [Rectinema sp.]